MLKKVAFVLALTVLVSFALALESGPSNTVGFTKTNCAASGAYTSFGLPFTFWDVVGGVPTHGTQSTNPSDILGSQLTCDFPWVADQVVRQDNGLYAFRNSFLGCAWDGDLENTALPADRMDVGRAYWILNNTVSALDVVLAGEVDTSAYGPIACAGGGVYTPLSFRDARVRPINSINLQTSGGFVGDFPWQADQLVEQATGNYAFVNSFLGNTWDYQPPTYTAVTPSYAYWVLNNHTAFNYNYGPGAVAPPPERPGNDDGKIDRITRPTRRSRSMH
ncbi:hypothetical protein KKG05_09805 [bacterium]|nr:hypothetical protein [bacterium]MBU1937680.1 hypothetical protein [bacterium]